MSLELTVEMRPSNIASRIAAMAKGGFPSCDRDNEEAASPGASKDAMARDAVLHQAPPLFASMRSSSLMAFHSLNADARGGYDWWLLISRRGAAGTEGRRMATVSPSDSSSTCTTEPAAMKRISASAGGRTDGGTSSAALPLTATALTILPPRLAASTALPTPHSPVSRQRTRRGSASRSSMVRRVTDIGAREGGRLVAA